MKQRIATYIIGACTVAIAAVIAVFLVMILRESFFPRQTRLVICTEDAEQVYSGEALTCEEYRVVLGTLRPGHQITMSFTGSQTLVGESENTAVAEIRDANGVDVTDHYAIELLPGTLKITPKKITVVSSDAEKIYDGKALTQGECYVDSVGVVKGHKVNLTTTGTQTDVGVSLNYVEASVVDAYGNDMTNQYEFVYRLGTLVVTPKKILISSHSASKRYDGTPLTESGWYLGSIPLCPGHTLVVQTSGEQTVVGMSENLISFVAIYEDVDGNLRDVTSNYAIDCVFGTLTVRP